MPGFCLCIKFHFALVNIDPDEQQYRKKPQTF